MSSSRPETEIHALPPRYTIRTNITSDAESEKRFQREIELGHFSGPAEIIAHALDLLDVEMDWLIDKKAIAEHLDESFAQIERGEGVSGDQVRAKLAKHCRPKDEALGLWSREIQK